MKVRKIIGCLVIAAIFIFPGVAFIINGAIMPVIIFYGAIIIVVAPVLFVAYRNNKPKQNK